MLGGVPIFSRNNQGEIGLKPVDNGNNSIPTRNSQGAPRQEVILDVNENQGFQGGLGPG